MEIRLFIGNLIISTQVKPTKETGTGWSLNDFAGVDFKKMLNRSIPGWMCKHLKTVTPYFLTLQLPLH